VVYFNPSEIFQKANDVDLYSTRPWGIAHSRRMASKGTERRCIKYIWVTSIGWSLLTGTEERWIRKLRICIRILNVKGLLRKRE
jgi:hypothetical protein